jgi:hypothetical protein
MRGMTQTETGNQDRRDPPFLSRGKRGKKKALRRKAKGKGRRPRPQGPLHAAMVAAAT